MINKLTRTRLFVLICYILQIFFIFFSVFFIKFSFDNKKDDNILIFVSILLLILIIITSIKVFRNSKMKFYTKTLKNKKLIVVKNIKRHYVNRYKSSFLYFSGIITNPDTKKKYSIIMKLDNNNFYVFEPKLHFNPKVLFVYVDENDYSKYYVDLKQTKDFSFKLNFKYFEDIFEKYDAFSEEKSVPKDIIKKECELDLKYLLKQNIVIEKEDKYYYSLTQADKVIKQNREKLRKLKKEYIILVIITVIISLIIGAIVLYIVSKVL